MTPPIDTNPKNVARVLRRSGDLNAGCGAYADAEECWSLADALECQTDIRNRESLRRIRWTTWWLTDLPNPGPYYAATMQNIVALALGLGGEEERLAILKESDLKRLLSYAIDNL